MPNCKPIFVALVCALVVTIPLESADKNAEKLLLKVQAKYESLDNVCADFDQIFYWKLTDETQKVSGHVCAKGGDRFRIETPEQTIVTDGKVLWTLNKINNQVIVDHAENAANDNPFIRDFMNKYIAEYDAQIDPDQSDKSLTCVLLTSKTGEHFVPQLWLWINKKSNLISKIKQLDLNENTTIFELKNMNTTLSLANSDFKFQIPDGADVIDMR